jgi:large subunit ribosomal protein L1
MARPYLSASSRPLATLQATRLLAHSHFQSRFASGATQKVAAKKATAKNAERKRKAPPKNFKIEDVAKSRMQQFSLCDAMRWVRFVPRCRSSLTRNRFLRAYEVGRPPQAVKYELAIRLKTPRGGPVIKSRIRLPHPVKTMVQIGVICPEGPAAEEALQNGAVIAGQQSLFEAIKRDEITFNRLICHESCEDALQKAGLGRILGPKGLMPSRKLGTVVPDVRKALKELAGTDEYRERIGAIRLPVGQLAYTPEMLADNIKALLRQVKKECVSFEEQFQKAVHEVVLATSHGPGFSLNGSFKSSDENLLPNHLSTAM